MTDPRADGPVPPPTRAERRAKRSRSDRRRARRNARRAGDRADTVTRRKPEADAPAANADDPTLEQPLPAVTVPEPEPGPSRRPTYPARSRSMQTSPAPLGSRRAGAPAERARRARRARRAAPAPARSPVAHQPEPAVAVAGPEAESEPVVPATTPAETEGAPARSRRARARGTSRGRRAPARPAARPERRRPSAPDRRRFWTRVMPAIGAALALVVVIGVIVRASDDAPGPDTETRGAADTAESMLLVHHSDASGNDLIAVVGRGGSKGSVLLVPTAVQLSSPYRGAETLAEIPVDDGGVALATAVENIVGVDVGKPTVVDDAALTAMLGPAAPMSVDLANPVDLVDRPSKYPAGTQDVSAAQAAELLGGQQSVNQLERMVTASSVLGAWLDRMQQPAIARGTVALSEGLGPLAAVASAPERRIDTLAVESIATGGSERYRVQGPELIDYVSRAFPDLRLGHGPRPRVEILNGTGALGVDEVVADAVVPAGGKVTLTDNVPGFGVPTTQIVYYEDRWRADAQRLLAAMNCGSLRKAGRDVGIADVTIVVGADCPEYGTPGGTP